MLGESSIGLSVCSGTRLVYDRAFLLECRNSPMANSPPVGLPQIPGVTCTLPASQMAKNGVNPGKHHGHVVQHGHVPVTAASLPPHAPVQPKKLQPAGIYVCHVTCLLIERLWMWWQARVTFTGFLSCHAHWQLEKSLNGCISPFSSPWKVT